MRTIRNSTLLVSLAICSVYFGSILYVCYKVYEKFETVVVKVEHENP